jgi:preprotein translocase subunit SecA
MSVIQIDDQVWFDSNRKLAALCAAAQTYTAAAKSTLILSHFPASLTKLNRLLSKSGVTTRTFSISDASHLCAAEPGAVWTGSARAFAAANPTSVGAPAKSQLQIIVLEHHPRRSQDQALIEAASRLSCNGELCFCFSLDDPLLLHFNGESSQKLFKRMGIDENESLSHHLITTAIRSAQEKIERQVRRDLQAESIEDWFRYNLGSPQ